MASKKAPKWCKQMMPKVPLSGCKASPEFDGNRLSKEAWGDAANGRDSGLTAFAYLWRRFGPPQSGSDDYKDLVGYILGTPMRGVFLTINPSGSPLAYACGYLATHGVRTAIDQPVANWWSRIEKWAAANGHGNLTTLTLDPKKKAAFQEAKAAVGEYPGRLDVSKWREIDGVLGELNRALFESMQELLRPVFVRDVSINILGCTDLGTAAAECSKYAGYGIPLDAIDKLIAAK